jgi:hypothetical protein
MWEKAHIRGATSGCFCRSFQTGGMDGGGKTCGMAHRMRAYSPLLRHWERLFCFVCLTFVCCLQIDFWRTFPCMLRLEGRVLQYFDSCRF